jgi:CRP/FNR family transcriptional regulator
MEQSILIKVPVFSGLDGNELLLLKEITRVKMFNKGDIIFFDTEPYLGFYAVTAGLVKIYKISKDAREQILHIVHPYNTFAEVPLFENPDEINEGNFRYPANAMAIEDGTEVVLIPAQKFTLMLQSNPKICLKMLSGFAKRLRHLTRHIEELTLMDVTKRVVNFIFNEYKKQPGQGKGAPVQITLDISKNDLASYLGTIIETLSRTFKKLQDEGIIEVEGKKIIISDLEKLKMLTK